MNAVSFDSTTLASADYDSATAILELSFRNGSIYRYFDVPESVFQALVAARSKGRFFNTGIKEHFPFVRLAGRSTSW